jgi:ATP-dependent Clp endopeptidase proteolytic subunit ClpP
MNNDYFGKKDEKGPKANGETIFKEPSFLESSNNRIYFYSEIDRERILQLNKTIREQNNNIITQCQIMDRPIETEKIFLHISSFGGSIFAGYAGMDEILKSKVKIVTIIDGCCASAATFLSVVGHKRYINEHGYVLIHQLSSIFWGKYAEFQDEMKNMDRFMKMTKDIYAKYTKVPMSMIDEILQHDIWFDAKQAVEYGIVDEIL